METAMKFMQWALVFASAAFAAVCTHAAYTVAAVLWAMR